MMVLQHDDGTNVIIYPADRCTWHQDAYNGSQYTISNARFYDGQADGGVALTGGVVTLGTIGKSGRFVGFSG